MQRRENGLSAILGNVPTVTDQEFLTVPEVAARLRLSIETIRRYLRSGELHGFQISRQAGWLITREDLERFIASRQPDRD